MSSDVEDVLTGRGDRMRVMLVAAHPDDEVIGVGSRFPLLSDLTLVHITDGAPHNMSDAHHHGFQTREAYAQARRTELQQALQVAGISPALIELGIPDQEATSQAGAIAEQLLAIFRSHMPAVILTHPYEGGHPDHDAASLAVHLAARAFEERPTVWEFACYHRRHGYLETGAFLPDSRLNELTIRLSPEQQRQKREMLACFVSQQETLRQFGTEWERFRPAPDYDFTEAPHTGPLNYERFPWGMTGDQFRTAARRLIDSREFHPVCP